MTGRDAENECIAAYSTATTPPMVMAQPPRKIETMSQECWLGAERQSHD